MTIKAECAACGRDCTNANASHYGDIYCISCLPSRPKMKIEPKLHSEQNHEHDDEQLAFYKMAVKP